MIVEKINRFTLHGHFDWTNHGTSSTQACRIREGPDQKMYVEVAPVDCLTHCGDAVEVEVPGLIRLQGVVLRERPTVLISVRRALRHKMPEA